MQESEYKRRNAPKTGYIVGDGLRHGSRLVASSVYSAVISLIVQWCRPAAGIVVIDMGVYGKEMKIRNGTNWRIIRGKIPRVVVRTQF